MENRCPIEWGLNRAVLQRLFALLLLAVMAGHFPAHAEEIIVKVDAAKTLGPVKKYIFGHNVEAADPRGIFSDTFDDENFDKQYIRTAQGFWDPKKQRPYPAIVEESKRAGITMLRYPGGCLASNFDWRKAVGPLEQRGDWRFGLDEYIQLCQALDAEPLITCSDYVLPLEDMPQHLADMVEYLNAEATPDHPWAMKRKEWGHPEPYGVTWFELGNESGAGNYYCKPLRVFTKETYSEYVIKSAAAMKAIDPSIKVGVIYSFGEKAYHVADFIQYHHYGPQIDGVNIQENFKSCMAHANYFSSRYIQEKSQQIRKLTGKSYPCALTEYNIYFFGNNPKPLRFSLMAGLMCADRIRVMLEPDCPIMIANYWNMCNGYFGMFRTNGDTVKHRTGVLPFYQLWGKHIGHSVREVTIENAPRFEASAAQGLPASRGENVVAEKKIKEVAIKNWDLKSLQYHNIKAKQPRPGCFVFAFNGIEKEMYLNLSDFKTSLADRNNHYRISFESRYVPKGGAKPTANIGLSLIDARGWAKARSGIAIDHLELDTKWTAHEKNFTPKTDCKAIDIILRAPNVAEPFYGTLLVRNFKIEEWVPETLPAYQGITATASLSQDENELYVVVFNKSFDSDFPTRIDIEGFEAQSYKQWTAGNNEPVDTLEYREPEYKTGKVSPDDNALSIMLKAHSMTAITFLR